jgi:hypothetical protein
MFLMPPADLRLAEKSDQRSAFSRQLSADGLKKLKADG